MSTTILIELTAIRCSVCGILFGIDELHRQHIQKDRLTFYCPNGHSQWYPGKTKDQELSEKAAELTRAKSEAMALKMKCEKIEADFQRHRKRSSAGTCPCCQRTFSNMARHMKTKHPEFKP